MKNMKKTLAFVLCVLSLVTMLAVGFADNTHVTSKASASEVKAGDTVTITVSMNEATVSSLGVTVNVPDSFEVVSGEWLKQGLIAHYDAAKNNGAFSPGSATAISGDIFRLTVKAKTADASAKKISVTVIAKNGADAVFTETTSKSIKVLCTSHNFGEYSKTDAEHARTCSVCGYTEKKSHNWDDGKVTAEATCTKEGIKTYTCKTCAHTKTETIKKLAHNYGKWTKVDDNTHAKSCSCGDTVKANHVWNKGEVTTPATCAKEGVKTYTCSDCGATKTEAISKSAHTYSNDCDTSCNNCGATRTTSHKYDTKWSTDGKNHWHQCSVCGDMKDKAAHTASDWIVDKDAAEMVAGSKHKECTVCKKVLETASIPALDCKHTAGTKISGKKDATCVSDGYTGDEVCKACKTVLKEGSVIDAFGHDTEMKNAKEATCKEDGYTGDEICKTCKKAITQGEVIKKGEHNVEVAGAKDATCTEDGFTGTKTCKTCGEVTDEGSVIPKLEHNYVDGVCSNCGEKDPDYVEPTTQPTTTPEETDPTEDTKPVAPNKPGNGSLWLIIISASVFIVAVGVVIFFVILKKQENEEDEEVE